MNETRVANSFVGQADRAADVDVVDEISRGHRLRQLRIDQAQVRQRYDAVLIDVGEQESDSYRPRAAGAAVGGSDTADHQRDVLLIGHTGQADDDVVT